jgi:hypothetical protein
MCESAWFLVLSQELSQKIENKTFSFYFDCYLYIYLITTTDFYKVPYSEYLKSQENLKVKRSTTSIKRLAKAPQEQGQD